MTIGIKRLVYSAMIVFSFHNGSLGAMDVAVDLTPKVIPYALSGTVSSIVKSIFSMENVKSLLARLLASFNRENAAIVAVPFKNFVIIGSKIAWANPCTSLFSTVVIAGVVYWRYGGAMQKDVAEIKSTVIEIEKELKVVKNNTDEIRKTTTKTAMQVSETKVIVEGMQQDVGTIRTVQAKDTKILKNLDDSMVKVKEVVGDQSNLLVNIQNNITDTNIIMKNIKQEMVTLQTLNESNCKSLKEALDLVQEAQKNNKETVDIMHQQLGEVKIVVEEFRQQVNNANEVQKQEFITLNNNIASLEEKFQSLRSQLKERDVEAVNFKETLNLTINTMVTDQKSEAVNAENRNSFMQETLVKQTKAIDTQSEQYGAAINALGIQQYNFINNNNLNTNAIKTTCDKIEKDVAKLSEQQATHVQNLQKMQDEYVQQMFEQQKEYYQQIMRLLSAGPGLLSYNEGGNVEGDSSSGVMSSMNLLGSGGDNSEFAHLGLPLFAMPIYKVFIDYCNKCVNPFKSEILHLKQEVVLLRKACTKPRNFVGGMAIGTMGVLTQKIKNNNNNDVNNDAFETASQRTIGYGYNNDRTS